MKTSILSYLSQGLLSLSLMSLTLGGSLHAKIDDYTQNNHWEFSKNHEANVSRMETIGWADRLFYFWAKNDGHLAYRAAKIELSASDKPVIKNEGQEKNFAKGWDHKKVGFAPTLYGDDLYLFIYVDGGKSMAYSVFRKEADNTAVKNISTTETIKLKLEGQPKGFTIGTMTAFTIEGEIYLLIGDASGTSLEPYIFHFDKVTKATYLGSLSKLGAPSGTTPLTPESTQRYRAANLIVDDENGDPLEVAVISYMRDTDIVGVVAFDGEGIISGKTFTKKLLGLGSKRALETVSLALGGLRGGPKIEDAALQLVLTSDDKAINAHGLHYTHKGGFFLYGSSLSYEGKDWFDNFPGASILSVRGNTVIVPSKAHKGSLRRVVVITGGGANSSQSQIDVNATQSDVLRPVQQVAIDTQNATLRELPKGTAQPILDDTIANNLSRLWNLLGVITGVPPYTSTTPPDKVTSSISWNKTDTLTSQVDHSSSASTSAGFLGKAHTGVGGFNFGAARTWTTVNSTKRTISFGFDIKLTAPVTKKGEITGWMVVYQPIILATLFHEYAPNNKDDYGRYYIVYTQDATLNADRNVNLISFPLTAPNDLLSPLSNGMFGGDPLEGWPSSNDPVGWHKQVFDGYRDGIGLPAMTTTVNASESASTFVDENNAKQKAQKIDWSMKLELPFDLGAFLGAGLGGGQTWTTTNTQSTAFSQALTLELSQIESTGAIGEIDRYNLLPYLLYPNSDANWIPWDGFPQSAPWCLSYIVTGLHKRGDELLGTFAFGDVYQDSNNANNLYSDWLGWLYETDTPWFFDYRRHRWLYSYISSMPDNFWYYSEDKSWAWTQDVLYPWSYVVEDEAWSYDP